MIDATGLVGILRRMEPHASGRLPVLRLLPGDPVDLNSLRCCASCDLPGIDVGQERDLRFATDGPDGLHGQIFPGGYIDFHLDAADACRDAVGHVVKDTKAVEGAGWGLLVGGSLCLLTGGAGLLAWLAAGGAGGAIVGAHVPARERWTVGLRQLIAATNTRR
jgi:hypothetical protein